MRIAVTGANGFIGQHLCPHLHRQLQAEIVKITRAASASDHNALNFSVSDEQLIRDLGKIDCLIHLAARAHTNASQADLERDNIELTERIAKLAVTAKIARVIYISSIKANGDNTQGRPPFNADEAPMPEDDYGRSKLACELIVKKHFANSPIQWVIIRPPLVYGTHNKGNLKSLEKLIGLGLPLPFDHLTNKRDLVSIENLCALIALAAIHPDAANQTFLVSDGVSRSTKEIVQLLARQQGKNVSFFRMPKWVLRILKRYSPKVSERLTGDLEIDISKTLSRLGWRPST